jgi:hypothetical protein
MTTMQQTQTMPYLGVLGRRIACRHEYGGERRADWHNLKPFWSLAQFVGAERHGQKQTFRTTQQWHSDSHFVGILGEIVVALEFGIAVDFELRIGGDGGHDFAGLDIKTSNFWRDPYLKQSPNAKHWPSWFGLVALDLDMRRGRLCGLASQDMVRQAPLKDWSHGPMHSLAADDLVTTVPVDICRNCGGRRP